MCTNVPTMLRLMFDECDLTRKSGVISLKSNLSEFNLEDHKKDVPEILDKSLVTFIKIILVGGQDDDFILKTFNALSASNNADLLDFVEKKRDS